MRGKRNTDSPEAVARREARRELARRVSAMPEEQRAALVERLGAIATIEGRALSVHNSCMILTQNPAASIVGGYQQWRRAGRCVRHGERALALWVPVGSKAEDVGPVDAVEGADRKPGFILGNVFDIAQTEPMAVEAQEMQAAADVLADWEGAKFDPTGAFAAMDAATFAPADGCSNDGGFATPEVLLAFAGVGAAGLLVLLSVVCR